MDTQRFIYPAECIGGCIVLAMLILYGEVKVGQGSHPSMPTGIEFGGGEQVGEGIVVSPYDEWFVHEVFLELVSNDPL